MSTMSRRTAALLTLAAPFATRAVSASPLEATPSHPVASMDQMSHAWYGNEQIAMLIYPQMTALDLIAPQMLFSSLMGATVHLVAKSHHPITSDSGVTITPTATFATCPDDLTVLFTPGGTDGTLAAATDPATRAFMADRGSRATYVTSVCSGSLILGAAGLLRGYRATSHWSVREALAGFGAIPVDARVVSDRNRITGAGVTAGLDFGLTMVAKLRGRFYAECDQLMCEYAPMPPFDSGTLKTAPADVRVAMVAMLSGFTKRARQLAATTRG